MLKQLLFSLIPTVQAASSTASAAAIKAKQASVTSVADTGEGISGLFGFIADHFFGWIIGIVIIVLFYVLAKSASKTAKDRIVRAKGEEVQENVLVLIERMTKIGVLTIGIVIAASINGLNLGTVIGAASLGIGFAIKDIIGNFISSIVMLAQGRIRIGDFVKVGDVMGTIVNIDTRVTVIQALDGTQVVIPNQLMLNTTLISYTTNPFRRLEFTVGVNYKTDLEKATSLIRAVIENDKDIVPKPAPMIVIEEFGESTITIRSCFWIESSGKSPFITRSNVAHRIKKAFDEAGIDMPSGLRTLRFDQDDRDLLKTIDSIKKGYVPEPPAPMSEEKLKEIAVKTGESRMIPHPLAHPEEKKAEPPVPTPPSQMTPSPKTYDEPATPPPTHI